MTSGGWDAGPDEEPFDGWDSGEPATEKSEWDDGSPPAQARDDDREVKAALRVGLRIGAALLVTAVGLSAMSAFLGSLATGSAGRSAEIGLGAASSGTPKPAAIVTAGPTVRSAPRSPSPSVPAATPSDSVSAEATVTSVVDGDTIRVRLLGVEERVRIIGLDSPESRQPGTPVECFALEATAAARSILSPGDDVNLVDDPTQDERDRFDRLLAHVILSDGTLFAEWMIENGWAVHYIYDGTPSIYADRLAAAHERARVSRRGLWDPEACAGDPHAATAAP